MQVEEGEEVQEEGARGTCTCSQAQLDRLWRGGSRCRASATPRLRSWARTAPFRSAVGPSATTSPTGTRFTSTASMVDRGVSAHAKARSPRSGSPAAAVEALSPCLAHHLLGHHRGNGRPACRPRQHHRASAEAGGSPVREAGEAKARGSGPGDQRLRGPTSASPPLDSACHPVCSTPERACVHRSRRTAPASTQTPAKSIDHLGGDSCGYAESLLQPGATLPRGRPTSPNASHWEVVFRHCCNLARG